MYMVHEKYVVYHSSKNQRCLCAQLRSDILPLMAETGRYDSLEEEMFNVLFD